MPLIASREVNEARRLMRAAGRVRSKVKKKRKRKHAKKPTPFKTQHENPQQPGDRDHHETARDETRPTRLIAQARFHISRVLWKSASYSSRNQ